MCSDRANSFHNVMVTFSDEETCCLLQIKSFVTGADPKVIIRIDGSSLVCLTFLQNILLIKVSKTNRDPVKFLAPGPVLFK